MSLFNYTLVIPTKCYGCEQPISACTCPLLLECTTDDDDEEECIEWSYCDMCDYRLPKSSLVEGFNHERCILCIRQLVKLYQSLFQEVGHNMSIIIMSYTDDGILTVREFHMAKRDLYCRLFWDGSCPFTNIYCLYRHADKIGVDCTVEGCKGGSRCLYNHQYDSDDSSSSDEEYSEEDNWVPMTVCNGCRKIPCVGKDPDSDSEEEGECENPDCTHQQNWYSSSYDNYM